MHFRTSWRLLRVTARCDRHDARPSHRGACRCAVSQQSLGLRLRLRLGDGARPLVLLRAQCGGHLERHVRPHQQEGGQCVPCDDHDDLVAQQLPLKATRVRLHVVQLQHVVARLEGADGVVVGVRGDGLRGAARERERLVLVDGNAAQRVGEEAAVVQPQESRGDAVPCVQEAAVQRVEHEHEREHALRNLLARSDRRDHHRHSAGDESHTQQRQREVPVLAAEAASLQTRHLIQDEREHHQLQQDHGHQRHRVGHKVGEAVEVIEHALVVVHHTRAEQRRH
mmetsp:Transcript_3903/g.12388  ORF Transcript_3903/g.12388 Transcript_3903/m.12388 type:complete len:282 (-) Transcript_3903:1275-2120(-)